MNLELYVPIWWVKAVGTLFLVLTSPLVYVGLGWCGVSKEWMFIVAVYSFIVFSIWIK